MCQAEFPEVGAAVQRASKQIDFSHGVCIRHNIEVLKKRGKHSEEQLKQYASKLTGETPDLKQHPELVKAYSQGIFTEINETMINETIDKLSNIVRICGYCQKEFPQVDDARNKLAKDLTSTGKRAEYEKIFTDGICLRHYAEMLKGMGYDDQKIKQSMVGKKPEDASPDLKQNPELLQLYSKGIFTKDQYDSIKKASGEITERLQVLAGIRKFHA